MTAPESGNRYRRAPGDAIRPDENAPPEPQKRPSARARPSGGQAPSPFEETPAAAPGSPLATSPNDLAPRFVWERSPRENDREWALFAHYRDSMYPQGLAGPKEPRKLDRMAAELGESVYALRDLCKTWNWVWRAAHYDRDVDRRQQVLAQTEQQRVATDHARIRAKVRELAELEVDKLLQRAHEPDAPQLRPSEIQGLLAFVAAQDQLAAGQPTGRTEHVLTDGRVNLDDLDYADLQQLKRLMQKGGGTIVDTTAEPSN